MVTFRNTTTESGHWYSFFDQRQVENVIGSKGDPVKPDLRHARKYQFAPGVTTILREAHKEQLVQYRERQVLLAALTLPRKPGEAEADYVDRILADAKEAAWKAAEKGSEIHGRIERDLTNGSDLVDSWVHETRIALRGLIPQISGCSAWTCERPVVHSYGFGTKSDLSGICPVSNRAFVVDIKTKDGDVSNIRLYPEHCQQLAATRAALAQQDSQFDGATCAIVFVSRTQPQASLVVAPDADVAHGWETFKALLHLWQQRNRYAPEWAQTSSLTYDN